MTKETIHLLQDPYLYNLFERGIRGGLTFINKHRTNAEVFTDNNGVQKRKVLLYIDENNLYGKAMCELLPHSNFKLLTQNEIERRFPNKESILALDPHKTGGFLLE